MHEDNASRARLSEPPTLTDRELVTGCLAGDKGAWTTLLDRYERLIFSVALRQGLSESQAGDVFQNVSLILLERLEQLRDVDRLAGWLVTVTRHAAWKELRRRDAAGYDPEQVLERQADSGTVEDAVTEWEAYQELHAALEELGGRCQLLLKRLYFPDPPTSYEAIAAELEMPIGSIGPTRARCLKKLRDIVHRREWHAVPDRALERVNCG